MKGEGAYLRCSPDHPWFLPVCLLSIEWIMSFGVVIVEIKIVLSKSGLHNLEEDDQALEMRTKLLMR